MYKKLLGLVFALLLLVVTGLLILSYSNSYPSFLPKKFIYSLDTTIASVPFIPKTTKQIVTKAVYTNQSLDSYKSKNFVLLKAGKIKLFELNMESTVENAVLANSAYSSKLSGSSLLFPVGSFSLETYKKNNELYFNLDNPPTIQGLEISKLAESWHKIDIEKFQAGLGVKAKSDSEVVTEMQKTFSDIFDKLAESSVFAKKSEKKVIKKQGSEYFEIKLKLVDSIFGQVPFLGESSKLENSQLTLLVESRKFYLTRYSLQGDIVPDRDGDINQAEKITFEISTELSDIGVVSVGKVPQERMTITSPTDLYTTITPQSVAETDLFQLNSDAKEFGENLLTIERLITVLMLLPKSI